MSEINYGDLLARIEQLEAENGRLRESRVELKRRGTAVGQLWRCKQDGRCVRVIGFVEHPTRVAVRNVETNRLSYVNLLEFEYRYEQAEGGEK